MKIYYTYCLELADGRDYIGVRGCNCRPENDDNYYGSSKVFKRCDVVYKYILYEFDNKEDALCHEIDLHALLDVARSQAFVNKSRATSTKFTTDGAKVSPETRARISAVNKGKKRSEETLAKMRGRKLSEEILAKRRGRKYSEESKARMSAAQKGRKYSEESKAKRRGRRLSEETKAKISATQRNKTLYHFNHPAHGERYCTEYVLISEFGLNRSSLNKVCNGRNRSVYGWTVRNSSQLNKGS